MMFDMKRFQSNLDIIVNNKSNNNNYL